MLWGGELDAHVLGEVRRVLCVVPLARARHACRSRGGGGAGELGVVVCDEGRDARAACCGRHLPLQRSRERAVQLNTLLIYNQQQDELDHQCRCGLKTKTIHVRGEKGIEIGARNNEACEEARSRRLKPDVRMVVTAQRLDRTTMQSCNPNDIQHCSRESKHALHQARPCPWNSLSTANGQCALGSRVRSDTKRIRGLHQGRGGGGSRGIPVERNAIAAAASAATRASRSDNSR